MDTIPAACIANKQNSHIFNTAANNFPAANEKSLRHAIDAMAAPIRPATPVRHVTLAGATYSAEELAESEEFSESGER
jgi:hypothetical protein